MKLISLLVHNYSNLFIDEVFNFSDEYCISFDFASNILDINKNIHYVPNIYGKTIYNITPIVGKNGSGKTSILNIIGFTTQDRIAHASIDDRYNLTDSYLLLFNVNENLFYIESVNLFPQNIDKLISTTSKFSSFYFIKENDKHVRIDFSADTNEKIYYIIDKYNYSTTDQFKTNHSAIRENLYIPRIINSVSSLEETYNVYLSLFKEKMIFSDLVIEFMKNESFQFENSFFTLPTNNNEPIYNIDECLMYLSENTDDFFKQFFSCIVNFYINFFNKNNFNESYLKNFKLLYNDCTTQWSNNKKNYIRLFNKMNNIIKVEAPTEHRLQLYAKHISQVFLSLYSIKQYIKPGYKFFKIVFPNNNEAPQLRKFLRCYDEFQDYISIEETEYNYENKPSNLAEDYIYDKEDFKGASKEYYLLPKQLFTINNYLLSTGEKNILTLISELMYEFKRFSLCQPIRSWQQNKTFIILVDEIEASMHLDWSRQFLNFLIRYLDSHKIDILNTSSSFSEGKYNVQLIFSTHSPFMLSDIVNNSTIALKRISNQTSSQEILTTFAQNIQEIMLNSLFIEDCFGEYAKTKLDYILKTLQLTKIPPSLERTIMYLISQIGEPIIKKKLLDMYSEGNNNSPITEQQNLIKNIQALYGELNEDTIQKIKELFLDQLY